MAEKTKRQMWEEGLRAKNPDKNFENEDDLYAAAMEGYDEVKGRLKRHEADDERMMKMLQEYPDVMDFIAEFTSSNGDFGKAYSKLPDYAKMTDDEKKSYDAERKSQSDKRAKAKSAAAEREANMAKAGEALRKFADDNGLTDEEVDKFVSQMDEFVTTLDNAKMDAKFFESMYRLFHYDEDIAAARETGKREGKNEAIASKPTRKMAGDGLPQLSNTGVTSVPDNDPSNNPIVNQMKRINSRNSIHEFNK